MSIPYNYVNIETFKMLYVGEAKFSSRHWGLMDHEGVSIRLDYLGYPEEKRCYLPYFLLKKLYTAFDNIGQYTGILFPGDLYEIFINQIFTFEESEQAHDNREGCFTLNTYDDEEGYIHLLPLLPELKNQELLKSLANDPTLDSELLFKLLSRNKLKGNIQNGNYYKYRHPRWSLEWLKYCEKLVESKSNLKILDYDNFLILPD